MQPYRMCGVVLWSSLTDGRAVIWCEDHGNLAFYSAQVDGAIEGLILDPGDLIEFDLHDTAEHRVAQNPRLLVEDHAPQIARRLQHTSELETVPHVAEARCDNVVAFPEKFRVATQARAAAG